jgi:hypothetical protein
LSNTTFNPSDKSAGITLSLSNTKAQNTTGTDQGVRATDFKTAGKYYFEVTVNTITNADDGVGIADSVASLTGIGAVPTHAALLFRSGSIWVNNSNTLGGFGTLSNGTVVGIAVDLDNETIWFRLGAAGNWNNSGTANPSTNTGGRSLSSFATSGSTQIAPAVCIKANGDNFTANFGDSAFTGTAPSGFTSGWPGPAATLTASLADDLGITATLEGIAPLSASIADDGGITATLAGPIISLTASIQDDAGIDAIIVFPRPPPIQCVVICV